MSVMEKDFPGQTQCCLVSLALVDHVVARVLRLWDMEW